MECQCASDPFLCPMPVLPVFMVHSFILVILEHVDGYFPTSGSACCWDVQGQDRVLSSCPCLSVHPPHWCYWTPISFVIQEAGNSQSLLCLPVSIHLAGVTYTRAFVIPKVGSSQPLVLGWNPELNWHFSLCFEPSCLDWMDSSTQEYASKTSECS